MLRAAATSFAITCAALLACAPAHAAPVQGYVAKPATAPTKASFIVRESMWRCDTAGTCRGPASTSSPATACALAARQLGEIATFEANGRAFDEAALARCNKKAG